MLSLRRILPLAMLLVSGCSSLDQLSKATEVDPAGWFSPSQVHFEVVDTTHKVDMQLSLRYDNMISADSVQLIVSTTAPDGVMWSEPFTIYTPKGRSSFNIVDTHFRRDVKFGQEGEYQVTFHPQQIYKGVVAVGVNIINN